MESLKEVRKVSSSSAKEIVSHHTAKVEGAGQKAVVCSVTLASLGSANQASLFPLCLFSFPLLRIRLSTIDTTAEQKEDIWLREGEEPIIVNSKSWHLTQQEARAPP